MGCPEWLVELWGAPGGLKDCSGNPGRGPKEAQVDHEGGQGGEGDPREFQGVQLLGGGAKGVQEP